MTLTTPTEYSVPFDLPNLYNIAVKLQDYIIKKKNQICTIKLN